MICRSEILNVDDRLKILEVPTRTHDHRDTSRRGSVIPLYLIEQCGVAKIAHCRTAITSHTLSCFGKLTTGTYHI
jgi:hypothetical protein